MEIAVLAKPLVIWSPTDVVNVLHGCQNLNESYKRTGIGDQQHKSLSELVLPKNATIWLMWHSSSWPSGEFI
ncbi:hypothetical protein ABG768_025400, partial [Culter alburnus]